MFDSKSILETLRSGSHTAEEIAQAFADSLNEANATYLAEQEEAKKTEAEKAEKTSSLQTILDSLDAWLDTYYGNHGDDLKAEEVIEFFDSMKDLSTNFSSHLETWADGLHNTIDNLNGKVTKKSEKYDSCDKVFEKFFKEFGLL